MDINNNVEVIKLVKRKLYIGKCECGESYEYINNPPRARQCSCGKIVTIEEKTFTSEEYRGNNGGYISSIKPWFYLIENFFNARRHHLG